MLVVIYGPSHRESSNYSAPDNGAEYCDERTCLSVCLSVCLSAVVTTGNTRPNFIEFCASNFVACGRVVLEMRSRTDRQTDRQAGRVKNNFNTGYSTDSGNHLTDAVIVGETINIW